MKRHPSETLTRTMEWIADLQLSRANRERRWILRNIDRGPMLIRRGSEIEMVVLPPWLYDIYASAARTEEAPPDEATF